MNGGRPLRFLVILLCGWSGIRGVDVYRRGGSFAAETVAAAETLLADLGVPSATAAPAAPFLALDNNEPRHATQIAARPARSATPATVQAAPATQRPSPKHTTGLSTAGRTPSPPLFPALLPPPRTSIGSRWSGSAWLIARDGRTVGVPGGQLGASQAGIRILYALDRDRRWAISGRVSAPLSGRGKEAAVGIDWQPTRAPIHVLVEHRISLDDGPSGPMVGIVGGFGPARVTPGIDLEAYGQAGAVARAGGGLFADGAVRASHPVATVGGLKLDVGAGLWGGAQRGAARLDIGPSLGLIVPLGGHRIRLSADWRQRIAGDARPDSGPALSIGTDF